MAGVPLVPLNYRLGRDQPAEFLGQHRALIVSDLDPPVRSRLRGAKTPALIIFRESLPHTPVSVIGLIATPGSKQPSARDCGPRRKRKPQPHGPGPGNESDRFRS